MSFANLAERLQPAVVNISTRQSVTVQRRQLPPGFEEFFRRFGGDGQNQRQQDEGPVTQRGGSLGSGFIISADGYIVTNNHVVAPARPDAVVEQITVTLADRTEYRGRGGRPRRRLRHRRAQDQRRRGRCPSCASAIRPAPGSATG